ncbi:MAG TPA: ABC-F family ATP-binding cassette domain-containing protein [Flavobacteriales bacterium]|nr:ABC-F family ATP-binding cassette domain-containing protein [Flavobacteriales bacterium]HMR26251.1 ABC-F family ATP-binding cassette domain-containing protein [Flavobacteriales bacterium]
MIDVSGLTLHFGQRPMFDGVSFFIGSDDRIGLVGRNGAGKSTLLKILAGQQSYDKGSIGRPRELTLGYLPQQMDHDLSLSPRQVAEKAFEEAQHLRASLDRIEKELETATEVEQQMELATMLAHAHERLNALGVADHDQQVERMLKGLGFVGEDIHRPLAELSGGWRMRAELARILLLQPDLLLLDEPTNHLDLPAIQWLEDLLRTYPSALVLISHDKTFLDRLTKRTLEVTGGELIDRKVPWSQYVELRKVEREQQMAAAKDQQKYIEKTQELINKYRAKASKAAFAQSLITKLENLDRIEVEDEDLRKLVVRFPPAPHAGKLIAEVKDVSKAYGPKRIFSHAELTIGKGEHLALVGANGTGKSTLIRMVVGEEPFEGEIRLGHGVVLGYYAQDMPERLEPRRTVLETAEDAASEENRPRVRAMLGAFLFSGEDVDKKVKVLSGGERARLALCCMLLRPLNFLLLDEPTHHLDIQSKDVLKEALKNYDGTFLLVSHDRDFLHGLTHRILELDGGRIRDQHLDILELIEKRKALQAADMGASSARTAPAKGANGQRSDYHERKERDKERRRVQNQVERAEKELATLEQEEKALQAKVMAAGLPAAELDKGYARLGELAQRIAAVMADWEAASARLDQLDVEA